MRKAAVIIMAGLLTFAMSSAAFAGEWKQSDGRWWYQNQDGTYIHGNGSTPAWQQINGKYYAFDASGWMYADTTTPDGYKVNSDGVWIEDVTGDAILGTYYFYSSDTTSSDGTYEVDPHTDNRITISKENGTYYADDGEYKDPLTLSSNGNYKSGKHGNSAWIYYNLEFTDKDTMLRYSEEGYATYKRLESDTANTGNTNVSKDAVCGTFRTVADKDGVYSFIDIELNDTGALEVSEYNFDPTAKYDVHIGDRGQIVFQSGAKEYDISNAQYLLHIRFSDDLNTITITNKSGKTSQMTRGEA